MRLNAVQKQGVIGSIRDKWMPAYKEGANHEDLLCTGGCMLCTFFWKYTKKCKGCPINIKTKLRGCRDTPFFDIVMREGITFYPPKHTDVGSELRYLISFLPEKEQDVFHKEMEEA